MERTCKNCGGVIYSRKGFWFHRGKDRILCPPMEARPEGVQVRTNLTKIVQKLRWWIFNITVCDNCRVMFIAFVPIGQRPSRCPRCNDDEIVSDDFKRATRTVPAQEEG